MPTVTKDTPRRCHVELLTHEERMMLDCSMAIETLPAHPLLTDAIVYLSQARQALADYVDSLAAK